MARHIDPFTPQGAPGREQLVRYVQGRLGPEERHGVELHLENDPLLRDAMEGLAMPGALRALDGLRPPPAGGPRPWPFRLPGALVAIGGTAMALWLFRTGQKTAAPEPPPAMVRAPAPAVAPAAVESMLRMVHGELNALAAQPRVEPERAATPDRFEQGHAGPEPVERTVVERLPAQPLALERGTTPPAPATGRAARPSRPWVFLHGLKVVHPSAFGWSDPSAQGSPGRPAGAEQADKDRIPSGPSARPYLDLLDGALGALARDGHREALDDLYFLLGRHPDDVNAQFYAGLACYRLGLYPRASRLLQAARDNRVDSFREEAEWYLALTMERTDGEAAAGPAFGRIAQAGGFYAEQARRKLQP